MSTKLHLYLGDHYGGIGEVSVHSVQSGVWSPDTALSWLLTPSDQFLSVSKPEAIQWCVRQQSGEESLCDGQRMYCFLTVWESQVVTGLLRKGQAGAHLTPNCCCHFWGSTSCLQSCAPACHSPSLSHRRPRVMVSHLSSWHRKWSVTEVHYQSWLWVANMLVNMYYSSCRRIKYLYSLHMVNFCINICEKLKTYNHMRTQGLQCIYKRWCKNPFSKHHNMTWPTFSTSTASLSFSVRVERTGCTNWAGRVAIIVTFSMMCETLLWHSSLSVMSSLLAWLLYSCGGKEGCHSCLLVLITNTAQRLTSNT